MIAVGTGDPFSSEFFAQDTARFSSTCSALPHPFFSKSAVINQSTFDKVGNDGIHAGLWKLGFKETIPQFLL